ncbi:FG-GAP-like repeat-containing protein [Paludisphaera mucosa]|uniref:FG-GAP-like repeat-containing protein n=1 Tax=Paludisphaera mucosa TaxID=3030827 RepID=A0ABT6FJS0_9BACT|nr:FG-GAP-like repeat-containing protein [Paludisphaera mucosa]MDG3007630.1 FG-GAP-like repeat-containing protein [Paludisphaera mucosa]
MTTRRRSRFKASLDAMEPRLCLSAGVDALSLGDVNGDQVADFAVAGHAANSTKVTIYSGWGRAADTSTGYAPLPLVTIENPLGKNAGPLEIVLADLNGDGVSELVVASTRSANVAAWGFRVQATSPYNAPVTAQVLSAASVPAGFQGARGLDLASADVNGDGKDELIVGQAATGGPARTVRAYAFQVGTSSWVEAKRYDRSPISTRNGVSLDAGDVTGDGVADLAMASKADGRVAVYDGALDRWVWTTKPFSARSGTAHVAVVSSENAGGSIVVTGLASRGGASRAAIVSYADGKARTFQPAASPGSGTLVPMGAGYVYQRSTLKEKDVDGKEKAATSPGPVTPTVFFASTGGDRVVVQGFGADLLPSKSADDLHVEPLGDSLKAAFHPLQGRGGVAGGGGEDVALVAYPRMTYTSPYRIDLSSAPRGFDKGLWDRTISAPSGDGWGPGRNANDPPTVPQGASNDWLRERVIAAYMSALGVDYQHHYDPTWLPTQGSAWNVASTVAYQSQGVDCTNFTAWAYADALGVTIDSKTTDQAAISASTPGNTVIPASLADRVAIQTIDHWTSYDDLVSQLLPGDILIIDGNDQDRSQATHAITWLGDYGKDANGLDRHLIIDSTGITPDHIDSNGRVVPEGVQIRPFGAPGTPNEWYFNHVGHVLRLIKADATAVAPIAGSALPTVAADADLKALKADEVVDALLVVRRRADSASRPSLESLAAKPLDERQPLSREDFAAQYGADPADVAAVTKWAEGQGLKVDSVDLGTRFIRVSGKVPDLEDAFGRKLYKGQGSADGPWVYNGEIGVPIALHDVIQGVFSVARPDDSTGGDSTPAAQADDTTEGYTPAQVADRYQFPDATGTGQTVGIIEVAGVIDASAREDFRAYFDHLGLPTPDITTVGRGTPAGDDEIYLDVEVVGALVPDARIVVYYAGGGPGDFFRSIQEAIHDAGRKIDVLSISDSIPEPYLSSMYLDVANQAFLDAAAMGVSVFTSAGDYGSSRHIADGLAHVEFPSASPWVTSVGGTTIARGAQIDEEVVWDTYTIQDGYLIGDKGSTGGGVSQHFATPSYQAGVDGGLDPTSVDPGHPTGRGGPDVASIADPQTGILIRARGKFLHDGGTSAGAPVWSALAARINQLLGRNVGFYNTLLYGPLEGTGSTHDVTVGDNVSSHIDLEGKQIPTYLGYDAHPGWDMTTGWGSPVGGTLLDSLRKLLRKP